MTLLQDKIPRHAIGLDIGSDSVRFLHVYSSFGTVAVKGFGSQKFNPSEGHVAITKAIKTLWHRMGIQYKNVVSYVPDNQVRFKNIEIPLTFDGDTQEWINENKIEILPPSVDLNRFYFAWELLHATETNATLMLAFCNRNYVNERLEIIEKAGLNLIRLAPGSVDVASLLPSAEEFLNETLLLFSRNEQAQGFLTLENMRLVDHNFINTTSEYGVTNGGVQNHAVETITDRIRSLENPPENAVFFDENPVECSDIVFDERKVSVAGIHPYNRLKNYDDLPSEYLITAGLALAHIVGNNNLNLLPEEKIEYFRNETEKSVFLKSVLLVGSFLLVLLLLINLLTVKKANDLEMIHEQLLQLNEQVQEFEQKQKEKNQLEAAYKNLQKLVTQKTQFAKILEQIGLQVPEGIWFQDISLGSVDTGIKKEKTFNTSFELRAIALKEQYISIFLKNLEQNKLFKNIALQGLSRIEGEQVWRQTKFSRKPLVQFTLHGQLQ